MRCKKCNEQNVVIQRVTTQKNKGRGILYLLLFGWLIDLMLWIFLTLPRLIWAVVRPRRIKSKTHSEAVCQSCGYSWRI